jgi:hypothetical protein
VVIKKSLYLEKAAYQALIRNVALGVHSNAWSPPTDARNPALEVLKSPVQQYRVPHVDTSTKLPTA